MFESSSQLFQASVSRLQDLDKYRGGQKNALWDGVYKICNHESGNKKKGKLEATIKLLSSKPEADWAFPMGRSDKQHINKQWVDQIDDGWLGRV